MSNPTPMGLLDGRYRLESMIGRGGTGTVYRALDTRLDRVVAVKMLRDVDGADEVRFAAEVRMLASFSHPNLVRVLDAGEFEGRPYLVMEIVEGLTLAQRLMSGSLPSADVATIGVGIARALAYVHQEGIVHRDVKPANILIDHAGEAHLADFGIARLIDTTGMTATGMTLGTLAYLAPEQIEVSEVGPPADIYALGLVMLECLSGHRAFEGTASEMTAARLGRDPAIPAGLDPPWARLLRAMTARDPRARPSSVDVAASLRVLSVAGQPSGDPITQITPIDAVAVIDAESVDDTELLLATSTVVRQSSSDAGAQLLSRRSVGSSRSIAAVLGLALVAVAVVVGLVLGGVLFHRPSPKRSGVTDPTVSAPRTILLPPTTSTTTTSATTTSTTTTSTTATTMLPQASVGSAASGLASEIQSALDNGNLTYPAAQALYGELQMITSSTAAGQTAQAIQQFDQLVTTLDQDVGDQALTGPTTISTIEVSVSSLATALGTSVPTTTATTPTFPGHGHHHGHGP